MRSFLFAIFALSLCELVLMRARGPKPLIRNLDRNVTKIDAKRTDLNVTTRVYGGTYAPEGKYKYMIFSMYAPGQDFSYGVYSCSASLIKEDWVLLASHCFEDGRTPLPTGVIVVGGKSDLSSYMPERLQTPFQQAIDESKFNLQERRAAKVQVNPRYNMIDKTHDVALIKTSKPFEIGRTIQTLPLSTEKMMSQTSCMILGWGLSEGNSRTYKLLFADQIYARSVSEGCEYKEEGDFLCLTKSNSGICQGDSGSPLVCDSKIWGVASHLVAYESTPVCGDDFEEYYSEIHPELEWINQQIGPLSDVNGGDPNKDGNNSCRRATSDVMMITALVLFSISRLIE